MALEQFLWYTELDMQKMGTTMNLESELAAIRLKNASEHGSPRRSVGNPIHSRVSLSPTRRNKSRGEVDDDQKFAFAPRSPPRIDFPTPNNRETVSSLILESEARVEKKEKKKKKKKKGKEVDKGDKKIKKKKKRLPPSTGEMILDEMYPVVAVDFLPQSEQDEEVEEGVEVEGV